MPFVPPTEACAELGVDRRTLARWAAKGHIRFVQPGGDGTRRLYDIGSLEPSVHGTPKNIDTPSKKKNGGGCRTVDVIYGRVSTRKQLPNLQRQLEHLHTQHPNHRIISDCASGLNYKRKGLQTILELAFEGRLREVRIAHRDRLCRFGFDLIEFILEHHGAKIIVEDHSEASATSDLADDILSIITVFGARLYGKRSGGKRRRCAEATEDETRNSSQTEASEQFSTANCSTNDIDR